MLVFHHVAGFPRSHHIPHQGSCCYGKPEKVTEFELPICRSGEDMEIFKNVNHGKWKYLINKMTFWSDINVIFPVVF